MTNFCSMLMVVALLLAGFGCSNSAQKPQRENAHKKVHYDSKTGRYYYVVREKDQKGNDNWSYYWLMNGSGDSPADYYSTPTFSRLPTNAGSWNRGNPPEAFANRPPTQQELDNPQEQTEMAEVEQSQTQENLGIPDENSLDSMEGVPESGSAESMSSGESTGGGDSSTTGDSGGGDSGGGGDGGGGGD
jgi:uncharacterized membrane protein YgcG